MQYYDIINASLGVAPDPVQSPVVDTGTNKTVIEHSYHIYELSVKVKDGRDISIREVMKTVEIFEDVFSDSIYGFVEILDRDGGLEKFVFSGGETLTITLLKPEPSTEIVLNRSDLIIHQVTRAVYDDNNSISYKLHFVPTSSIAANKKRMYRAYRNENNIGKIISKIYNEIGSTSELYSSTNAVINQTFVCPGYKPFTAINYLKKRAASDEKYFLFFERAASVNGKKHFFSDIKSVNIVTATNNQPMDIVYNPSLNYIHDNSIGIRAVSVAFENNYNNMENMINGLYNTNIKLVDLKLRREYNYDYNFIDLTNQLYLSSLQKTDIFSQYNSGYPETPGERYSVLPINDPVSNKSKWITHELLGQLNASYFRCIVEIPGANYIGAGNAVGLTLPSIYAKTLNYETNILQEDQIYSGKYLVTAVRHIMTSTTYTKKLELTNIDSLYNVYTISTEASAEGTGADGGGGGGGF